jgi:hypothetical protein
MQPVSGYSCTNVIGTAAGTTTFFSREGVFQGVHFGTATTGTVTFYDNTDGGTSKPLMTVVNAVASSKEAIHAGVKKGLSAVYGGTVDMLVTYL